MKEIAEQILTWAFSQKVPGSVAILNIQCL